MRNATRFILVIYICTGFGYSASAQTNIYDTVRVSRFTKAGSPYIIHGTVSVVRDLVIDPGVVVRGENEGSFSFDDATLRAVGAIGDSIVFRSLGIINLGGCDRNWVMNYCTFTEKSGIHLYCAPPRSDTIAHCSFRGSLNGMRLFAQSQNSQTQVLILSCVFTDKPTGLVIDAMGGSHALIRIEDNLFSGNQVGLDLFYCDAQIFNNRFLNQTVQSIHVVSVIGNVVTIGGAPDRCNTIDAEVDFNCSPGMTLDARYNYWGTNDTAVIAHTMLQSSQGTIQYLPITNDYCQPVTGIEIPTGTLPLDVRVYPNPATAESTIQVTGRAAVPVQYELYDLGGALLWYRTTDAVSPAFPVMPPGVYFLRARQGEAFGYTKVAVK